jgi:hypothetical protein
MSAAKSQVLIRRTADQCSVVMRLTRLVVTASRPVSKESRSFPATVQFVTYTLVAGEHCACPTAPVSVAGLSAE